MSKDFYQGLLAGTPFSWNQFCEEYIPVILGVCQNIFPGKDGEVTPEAYEEGDYVIERFKTEPKYFEGYNPRYSFESFICLKIREILTDKIILLCKDSTMVSQQTDYIWTIFEYFYRIEIKAIIRYKLCSFNNPNLAMMDIYQSFSLFLMEDGFRKLRLFKAKTYFIYYLRRMVNNFCSDLFRKDQKSQKHEEFDEETCAEYPDTISIPNPFRILARAEKDEERKKILDMVEQEVKLFKPENKLIFYYRFMVDEPLKPKKIAELMKLQGKKVTTSLSNSKIKLRKQLTQRGLKWEMVETLFEDF